MNTLNKLKTASNYNNAALQTFRNKIEVSRTTLSYKFQLSGTGMFFLRVCCV